MNSNNTDKQPRINAEVRKSELEQLVVICGEGRSGTTLLHSKLNAHPDVAFPPETHFFRRYVALSHKRRRLETRGPEAFARVLAQDEDFARAGIGPEQLLAPYLAGNKAFRLDDVYQRLLAQYMVAQGKSRSGDKDPRNIDYLPALQRYFPQAYVLHLIRDPRDVLLSRLKAQWSAHRPYWLHILIYREQRGRGRRLGPHLFGGRYLEIRYEDLITDPEATLRRVCEHINLPYSPAMLDFSDSARQLIDIRELHWKSETMGPLLQDNKEKWRIGLTPSQIILVERICKEPFQFLDYVREKRPIQVGFFRNTTQVIMELIARIFSAVYPLLTKR